MIEFSFKCVNIGLVDSVKFVIGNIVSFIELDLQFFYLYKLLNDLLNDSNQLYVDKLAFKSLAFHQPPSQDNYTAWLGGAIFGSLDILDNYSIHNSKYKDLDKIPDWFNITAPTNSSVLI